MKIAAKPCRHGNFHFPIHDTFIGRSLDVYGEYSEDEVRLFAQIVQPGATVLDIGANIGTFTVPLSRMVGDAGRVWAIEPQEALFDLLHLNCLENDVPAVMAIHAAAGAAPGKIAVPRVDYNVNGNFGGVAVGTGADMVPVIRIDSLNLPRCDFMKIDVEGAELEVLQGAAKVIERCRPVMYLENDRKEKSEALLAHLFEIGYRCFWHLTPLVCNDNFNGATENLWPGMVSVNMLCVPREFSIELNGFAEITDAAERPAALKGAE